MQKIRNNFGGGVLAALAVFGALFCAGGAGLMGAAPETEFVVLSGGNFLMGNAFTGEGLSDELPVHTVRVDTLQMGSGAVSFGLWKSVRAWASVNGYVDLPAGRGKSDAHPVEGISWNDAVKWCNARSEMEGMPQAYKTTAGGNATYRSGAVELTSGHVNWAVRAYRLPTEAEWEFAARGGQAGQRFSWSEGNVTHTNANLKISGWWDYEGGATGFCPGVLSGNYPYTNAPGAFLPNGRGLYDVCGNVWEWCWDYYGAGYYAVSEGENPRGASEGSYRVLRGGAWNADGESARLSKREVDVAAAGDYGFRLVLANDSGEAPVIVTQPSGGQFGISSEVTISVAVRDVNEEGLSYQWKRNGSVISGATGAELVIARFSPKNVGNYTVDIRNRHGTTTSAFATLSISPFTSDELLSHALNPHPMNTKSLLSYLPRIVLAGATLTVSYAAQDPDLDYIVQTSTDLVNWTNQSSVNGVANVSTGGADKMFARLMVEAAEGDGAVYACTKPEGYVTRTLPTGGSSTYFGDPMEPVAMFRFEVGAVGNNTLTFANAAFETDQFTESPFWARIITGNQAGRYCLIKGNTETVITVDVKDGDINKPDVDLNIMGWAVQAGDIIEIAPADTLLSYFTSRVMGGDRLNRADVVNFWKSGGWISYYYNNVSNKWVNTVDSSEDANNIILRPEHAWNLVRRSNTTASNIFVHLGTVPEQQALMRHIGSTVITIVRFPVSQKLQDFEYQSATPWATDASRLNRADVVNLWEQGNWVSYWKTAAAPNGIWRQSGDAASADFSEKSISAGDAVSVLRRNTQTGINGFFAQPLPYPNPRL